MKSIIPHNLTGKSLYDYLVKNEGLIFHAKKSTVKKGDEVFSMPLYVDDKGNLISKAEGEQVQIDPSKLKFAAVINTTNWLDSHGDVHIPGLWKKSLSDNKKNGFYLLQSHGREFEDVIAEGCAGATKSLSWRELGLELVGTTEALVFSGVIEKDRNEYMFGQYQKGYVKKHSVGMRYIKMVTCINDDDYPVQKENWDKYIEVVANRDQAEDEGYFWAILEAQCVEGSAVLFASNSVTPTLETSLIGSKSDTVEDTINQPLSGTEKKPLTFDLGRAIQDTKFFN
jgi:hypothetical protein